jgi:heat shock protein HslJ
MAPAHQRSLALALIAALATTACERDTDAEPANASPDAAPVEAAVPGYRARGNEPFWSIEAHADELRWTTPDAPDPLRWSAATRADRADGFDLGATREGSALTLSASATICRDSMTGMPHPHTVVVTIDEREFTGCGGEPIDLLAANAWIVASIDGAAIVGEAPTIGFDRTGRASGSGACNRWMSEIHLTGEGLGFARAASTMMACPEAAMRTERHFLDALARVTRHDFDASGNLLLKAGDDTVIVATAGSAAPD